MNLCLATIGNNAKQYIALGLRLAADGHRVRVATKEKYRQAVVARGLEFYPLGGELENFGVFVEYLESAKHVSAFKRRAIRRHLLQAFKDLLYSLLPAAIGTDPHGYGDQIPGEFFRADALLWHPLFFGHLHVAEYLGIPLQCASLVPFSPTSAFGPILSSCFRDDLDALNGGHKAVNWQSYSEVDASLWHGMVTVVNQFRSSLGLSGRYHESTPFGQWGIPHVYLWSPAVLQAPSDWGAELAVTGYFTLEDELERRKLEECERSRSLDAFALSGGDPVLFFGISTFGIAPRSLRTLLRTIDEAAQSACVQIILQLREWRDPGQEPYRSKRVFEVKTGFPYALILRKVVATIHWGAVGLVEEGLRAGKPVCVCARLSTQYFAARKVMAMGVGIAPIDLKTCTMSTLVSSFQGLLQPQLQERAQALAETFDSSRALEQAIRAFYGNLPLRDMRCDLDEERIARIYDPHHQLKLSLEAYLAIKAMRTHDGRDDVAYRPVSYSGRRRSKRRIRGPRDELPSPMSIEPAPRRLEVRPLQRTANELTTYSRHAVEGATVLLFRGLRSIGLAHSAVAALDPTRGSSMALPRPIRPRRSSSIALVTEVPSFWATEAQEEVAREAVNKSYEKAMARRIPAQYD
ncbi:hypothetical protein BBJ28_00016412 [Nothophytophthora sp. Chile5]|nr:hypothetical protein BBJ28_00016412 [Nothophytophthora sp. Chile5]